MNQKAIRAMVDARTRLAVFRNYSNCEAEVGADPIWEAADQAALDQLDQAIKEARGEVPLFAVTP